MIKDAETLADLRVLLLLSILGAIDFPPDTGGEHPLLLPVHI